MVFHQETVERFKVPNCPKCSAGVLKPNVTFFGDSVPVDLVQRIRDLVKHCDSMLVVGSSLYVFSGYRFVVQAKELGKKIAILNIGKSRADEMAHLRIHARAGDIMSKVEL